MDQEYEKKFNEMQKYLPFLQKIIEKLKVNNNNDPDNPRKAQLQKMEMLHGLLTSKGKKLKMETLLKCEGVLIKLHTKMEKINYFQSNTPNSTLTVNKSPASNAKESIPKVIVNTVPIEIVDITGPSSPPASPQTMEEPTRPIEIPTERRSPLTVIETTTTKATKSTYEDTKNVHHGSKQQHHQHHHRRHHRRPENNNNKSRFESSVEKLHRSCDLDTSTSSKSTSSSHLSEYRDNSLEQFRNPDREHDHERSSWHRKNEDFSSQQLKNKTDNNNQPKPLHLTTERVSSDSAYSPEESWDEITKADTKIHKSKNISETATTDLLNDSVPPLNASNSTTPATYDNIIFKYKKRENDMESPNQKDKTIFARLGGKVADSRYQNFSINVVNDRMKASKKDNSRKTTPASTGPPLLRTNLAQPPLADVLKSPPLSANDISQLLDETIDMNVAATENFTTNSISSIGTRRPAKTASDTAPPTTSAATSLDMVRKKLAMISGGININDGIISKNSPQFNDSPASPPPTTIHNIPSIPKSNSTHNERIALKYHPHPRIERDSITTTTIATAKTNVVAAPFNVLPAINHFDPRLKKAAAALAAKPIPSLLDLPITQHSNFTVPKRNDTITSFNSCNNPRNMQPFSTGKDNYNRFESHPPPRSAAPPPASKSFKNTNNSYQNNSPEECWDTDPEDSIDAGVTPIKTATPNLTNADPRKQTPIISGHNAQSSPLVETKKSQSSPHVQAKKPQKGGYSSEENWDSDPETPVTSVPQPNVTPQANFATQREPISEPVAKLITLIKSDPRLQNSKTTQQSSFTDRHANTSITKHQSTGEYWDLKTKSTTSIPPNSLNIPNLSSSPNHQHPSNSNRFSALLKNDNDKTERQKYFESKKQKHMEPRTYAEFKKAKARAAAEEASRKANNEGSYHKENKASSSSATPNKQTIHQQTKESKVPISNATQKESDDKTSTTKPSLPASNLDKLYRSANFTAELPKAMNKFKIPKKQNPQTEEKIVNEKKDENVAKDAKSVDLNDVNVKSAPKKSEIKKDKSPAIKIEKTTAKIKEESVAPLVTEKRSVESLIKEKLGKLRQPISEANTEGKQPTVEEIKKLDSVETKVKPINNSEESKITLKKDGIKVSKAVDAFDGLKKKTEEEKELESELKKQASPPVDVEETKAQTEAEKIDINIKSPSKSKTNDLQIREIPLRGAALATSSTPPVLQPQRILRRRCTMIAYASAPEVDKEKIHAANALLFEDLQEREKLKRKAAELEKLAQRRSKHLADMFQKTDDNCTVSTQNIIIGKRRTRTTVNFNEIQQAQAVFKHIKPKEPKSENTNAAAILQTTANSNINVTTAETKKVPPVNKKSTIKGKTNKNEKEDQSCTVSSTTSSLLTDDTPTFSGRKSRNSTKSAAQKEEETLDNEPSSSAKSTNPTPTPFDEDNQELLEGFMKDMFKPNANTKFVLNLLSQILKPKQLQQVKKIVESAAKAKEAEQQATVEQQPTIDHENDDVEDNDEEEEVESVTSETTQEQSTRHAAKNEAGQPKDVVATAPRKATPKNKSKTYKKKNELDRLNEDIRDMFISQGVITATGRRMCTLAAAAEAGTKTDDSHVSDTNANNKKTDEKIGNKKIKSEIKDVTDVAKSLSTPLRIRKSKVVISPINLSNVRRSLRVKGTDTVVEDDNKETINNEKPNNETVETAASEIFKPHSPERKMPVLKPNTPIKLSDEEQLEEIEEKLKTKSTTLKKRKVADQQLKPTKLCPKSKQTAAVVMESGGGDNAAAGSDDSDEDIQLSHLRKRLKSSSKNSDEDEDVDEANDKDSNSKANVEKQKSIIGNTNSHWHSQSKYAQWCVICDAKFTHIALHYKVQHNNSEYYSSRIAPNILQQYKQGKLSSPIFGTCRSKQKNLIHWFYRCPFCLQHNRNLIRCWVEHFSKHTGEYLFECSKCHKAGNGPALIEKHIESNQCAGASVIRHQYPINQKLIKAHICHLCNYLQLYRINLERHYIEQHKCDPDRVTVLGYSINLLNTDGVEVVDAKKASEMEITAIEKYTRESLIIVDDDDDDEVDQKLLISNVEKQNIADASEAQETSAVQLPPLVEKESNEKIKLTEIPNVVLDKITCENLKAVDCKVPNVFKDLQDLNDEKSSAKNDKPEHKNKQVINTEKLEQSSTNNTDGLKQIDEIEDLEKMIADVQEEVLAYAAKAEAEEKAREEALRSNIFTTSTNRNNTDSPTIDCLTQSLRTIEQEEQLQQQKTYTAQKTQQLQLEQSANTAVQRTPVMSIADRLSQRFKDIKVRSFIDKSPDIEPLLPSGQKVAAESTSVNTSISDDTPNLVIADDIENENFVDEAVVNDENMTDQDPDSEEDDGDWEDIEISESAPSANTSSISAGSSCASATNKEKQKKKKVYQSLSRFYSSNKKGNSKAKKNTNFVNISASVSGKKQRSYGLPEKHNQESTNDNASQLAELIAEKQRPLIHNLADLLPDSPCNDPMELVPELAPNEPLQDLNDISALLEANFSSIDAQNILQQLDMPLTANSICINVEGQQQSIQDALDFVTEQQQRGQTISLIDLRHINEGDTTTINPNTLQVINRIQNLGYSKNLDAGSYITKFYCLSKNCSFLYSNESIGLENHYLSEHPQIKWNGFCSMCKQQFVNDATSDEALPITQEFRHMIEQHVDVAIEDPSDENSTTDDNESKPRIKLRRLTGDCLSSTTPTKALTPEIIDSPTPCKDLINMTLTDLLNAEPRPLNLKTRPEIAFMPINKIINNPSQIEESVATPVAAKPMPLFTNIGKEFAITSVSSANMEIIPINNTTGTQQIQISNVVSLSDSTDIANTVETDCNNGGSMSSLPKISNVCSLNSRVAGQKSNAFNAATLWKEQIESDRIELAHAAEESLEVSRILQSVARCRSPPTDKLGELLSSALREDSPTVVAEILPTATSTSGDFLITQTVSAQYVDNNNETASTEPQLGFNISIASTTMSSLTAGNSSSPILPDNSAVVSDLESPCALEQFRCMGTRCAYQTRVVVAMMEHLRFHERRNFSTDHQYLRCSLCAHSADSIESYFQHAQDQHSQQLGIGVSSSSSSNANTCALTQKIQNILRNNIDNRSIGDGSSANRATTPSAEPSYKQQLEQTIKEMVASTGLAESKVFRCPIKGCTTSLCETSFHKHLIYHLTTLGIMNVNNYSYKCPHCTAVYHRPTGIKAHIKNHARHSVFCYMCMATTSSTTQMLKHFCEKHWKVTNIITAPLLVLPNTTEIGQVTYLLAHDQQISPTELQQFGEKLISELQRKKAASKTHFGFNEINLLPIQPIFQNEVHCAECNYKTKVRTNMYRHLQMHKTSSAISGTGGAYMHVASVDPVNPVPCLNSNERHFDKMCNLASSSLVTGNSSSSTSGGSSGATAIAVKPPLKLTTVFISESRRFTCGVPDCQYLTVSDDIFRSHLSTLHSNLQQYLCPFCKDEISVRTLNIERIMQHLRFHSQKIYQCEECDYLHYMKNVVERHIQEKHVTQRVNLITHDRKLENVAEGIRTLQLITGKKFKDQFATRAATAADVPNNSSQSSGSLTAANSSLTTAANTKNKWECDICKHRTMTYNQMISHASVQHACKQQYQCVHCQFGATQLTHIMTHIDEKHPTKTREARYVFHKINSTPQEKEADTRPLWQRDDPKRIRHIRGILMEDEEESEQYRKLLCLDGDEVDDDDDGLENGGTLDTTATTQSNESILSNFEYACYHCDYKSSSFTELKYEHWQRMHNVIARDAKPFYFRLLTSLKCAECLEFYGDYNELERHLQDFHKTRSYLAADGRRSEQLECGYCNFNYLRTEQLVQHYNSANHQPQDIKTFTIAHLAASKFLGTPQTYNQCMICNELFANRMSIVAHERAKHKNDPNFSFKEIKNTIIYRCPLCFFSSVDEMTTLRHMIDHYGQFKRCYFCYESQATFSSYMQHCYTEHREEVKKFSEIYTIDDITKYLQLILVIFPNGLIMNKRNLANTKYGRDNSKIRDMYKEICKIAQQPPIPRLSIARLVARKSVEASRNNSPNPDNEQQIDLTTNAAVAMQFQAKKITKRRQTVAFGSNDSANGRALLLKPNVTQKKRKISESTLSNMLLTPPTNTEAQLEPYSFYGKKAEPLDLSKIYTKVAIAGLDTQLTINNFKGLFKIDAEVVVEKLNLSQINTSTKYDNSNEYRHVKKACPASLKHKYV